MKFNRAVAIYLIDNAYSANDDYRLYSNITKFQEIRSYCLKIIRYLRNFWYSSMKEYISFLFYTKAKIKQDFLCDLLFFSTLVRDTIELKLSTSFSV